MWLGLGRALGGGSPIALEAAYLVEQIVAVALIVLVVQRLLGPRSAWIMAILLLAFEWSFTNSRLLLMWNPYAVALPALLLLVSAAALAAARKLLLPLLACVVVGSFLVQTHVSTTLFVGAVLAGAAVIRIVLVVRRGGWPAVPARAAYGVGAVVIVVAAVWALPVYEQLTHDPGNVRQLRRFQAANTEVHDEGDAVGMLNHVLVSFPLRTGDRGQVSDADERLYRDSATWKAPVLAAYLLGGCALFVVFVRRRDRRRAALAGLTVIALGAAAASAAMAIGPLYPYLVSWTAVLSLPLWLLALELGLRRLGDAVFLVLTGGLATVVGVATLVSPLPRGRLGAEAWEAARPYVQSPGVETVLVRPATAHGMPHAAAIANAALRAGKRVELPDEWLFLVDPGFRARGDADVEIIVCCSESIRPDTPGLRVIGTARGTAIMVREPRG
jgi:hypothetical protein